MVHRPLICNMFSTILGATRDIKRCIYKGAHYDLLLRMRDIDEVRPGEIPGQNLHIVV